jgi:hypothetical protein
MGLEHSGQEICLIGVMGEHEGAYAGRVGAPHTLKTWTSKWVV